MSFLNGCYRRVPSLRVRPVEEMRSCVVFRPNPPKLFMLNLNAWLIFELCDGCTSYEIEQRYRQKVEGQMSESEARRHLAIGLKNLHERGLIELEEGLNE